VVSTVCIPARFCGPRRSANGGYAAGLLAEHLGGSHFRDAADPGVDPDHTPVRVRLRQPPPLDVLMQLQETGDGLQLTFGGAVIAEAGPATHVPEPVDAVTPEEAEQASSRYPGHTAHPFPTCFACGTERDDGLRIFPGEVPPGEEGRTRTAALWTPDSTVAADYHQYDDATPRAALPVAWAALDCVGGWAGDLTERLMVLGEMTALVDELPVIGEPHVVVGEHRGTDGRKTYTASTLHDSDGRIVGRAEHVWFAVDPALFNG
jgi:hypothetical protein